MVYRVVMGSNEDRAYIEDWFGSFNDFPPGWKEVTPEEFAKSQVLGSNIAYVETRQMRRPEGNLLTNKFGHREHYTNATLFHFGDGRGFALVSRYWEGETRFFTFDCLPLLRERYIQLPIMEDSNWGLLSGSNPGRGISNYGRTIRFHRQITDAELNMVVKYLSRDNCPGWTGIGTRKLDDVTYYFTTTWDSSD